MRFQKVRHPLKNRYVLLRHGQTDANGKKIYMGRLGFGLNDTGVEQANQVTLPNIPDIVFHSPLKRAWQTAEIAARKLGIENIIADERLLEKAGGDIDGLQYDQIAQQCPESWGIWDGNPLEYIVEARFPNGESDLDVAKRLDGLFAELEDTHQGKTILLVTHSGVIQAARYLFGQSKENIYFSPISNCQVEVYE